jgi:hypothetical protein
MTKASSDLRQTLGGISDDNGPMLKLWEKVIKQHARFQFLTGANMNMTTFWDMQPCNLVEVDWRFRSAYCLHQYDDAYSLHHLRSEDKSSTHPWHFSQIARTAWRYIPERCHIQCSWNIAPYVNISITVRFNFLVCFIAKRVRCICPRNDATCFFF